MSAENFSFQLMSLLLLAAGYVAFRVDSTEAAKCKGMSMKVYEMDKMWMIECMKETEAKTAKEAVMMPCFRKCMVIKRGIVDDFGIPHKEKAAELVKLTVPDSISAELASKTEKCVEMHGSKVKEWKMTCESYLPVCQCMLDAYTESCKM